MVESKYNLEDDVSTERIDNITNSKRKIDLALVISIIALFTTIIQLIFTSPYFLDNYNMPNIVVQEGKGQIFSLDSLQTNYLIHNDSKKTANNLVLSVNATTVKDIQFIPYSSFKLIDSTKDGIYKTYIYTKEKLVPFERVTIGMRHHRETIKINSKFEIRTEHCIYYSRISELKSDFGYYKIKYLNKGIFIECN